ncbi:hypothetical protein [Clostridium sp.]|uniref:hypothetical protein n=1 Tax=Clostridium sp. TaxID=1506 RepID=UPI001A5000F8|nr:hypothetical protein [Clostridium sp.]MBK5234091.1 hypothetical protein [Clostridium sp.]
MAKNWTMTEATQAIIENSDTEALLDLGRRFPLTSLALARMGRNVGAEMIINALPEHVTVRKIEAVLKSGVDANSSESDDDEDDEEAVAEAPKVEAKAEKPAKKEKPAKAAKPAKTAKAAVKVAEEDEEDLGTYAGDTAQVLYKECKKRGIKVKTKQVAKFYADLLIADDAKTAVEPAEEAEADEDEWDI